MLITTDREVKDEMDKIILEPKLRMMQPNFKSEHFEATQTFNYSCDPIIDPISDLSSCYTCVACTQINEDTLRITQHFTALFYQL